MLFTTSAEMSILIKQYLQNQRVHVQNVYQEYYTLRIADKYKFTFTAEIMKFSSFDLDILYLKFSAE